MSPDSPTDEARRALSRVDPVLRRLIAAKPQLEPFELLPAMTVFEGLVVQIVGQQLSVASAAALDATGAYLAVVLSDGARIETRTVLVATGAQYRALPLPRWEHFEGAGIYYAATALEAAACVPEPVTVVGGANSAGQAALVLASQGSRVTLAVRGDQLGAEMSSYLVDRLLADPRVHVRTSTEVTALIGDVALEAITLTDRGTGSSVDEPCHGLFCFIGADPATDWLSSVALDSGGFVKTDVQLQDAATSPVWTALGRAPLPYETSLPGVFAAGDVRIGSLKRVASAVGEGASAVRSIHAAIGTHV